MAGTTRTTCPSASKIRTGAIASLPAGSITAVS
jgi:hypothetical protein